MSTLRILALVVAGFLAVAVLFGWPAGAVDNVRLLAVAVAALVVAKAV